MDEITTLDLSVYEKSTVGMTLLFNDLAIYLEGGDQAELTLCHKNKQVRDFLAEKIRSGLDIPKASVGDKLGLGVSSTTNYKQLHDMFIEWYICTEINNGTVTTSDRDKWRNNNYRLFFDDDCQNALKQYCNDNNIDINKMTKKKKKVWRFRYYIKQFLNEKLTRGEITDDEYKKYTHRIQSEKVIRDFIQSRFPRENPLILVEQEIDIRTDAADKETVDKLIQRWIKDINDRDTKKEPVQRIAKPMVD